MNTMSNTESGELSTGVLLADKQDSSEQRTEQIGTSPFIKVTKEDEAFIALGQYRLTGLMDDKEKVEKLEKQIGEMDWEFMIAVIGAITTQTVNRYKDEQI